MMVLGTADLVLASFQPDGERTEEADHLWQMAEQRLIWLHITDSCLRRICDYIEQQELTDRDRIISWIEQICEVIEIDEELFVLASNIARRIYPDESGVTEVALEIACALTRNINALIVPNPRNFPAENNLPVLSVPQLAYLLRLPRRRIESLEGQWSYEVVRSNGTKHFGDCLISLIGHYFSMQGTRRKTITSEGEEIEEEIEWHSTLVDTNQELQTFYIIYRFSLDSGYHIVYDPEYIHGYCVIHWLDNSQTLRGEITLFGDVLSYGTITFTKHNGTTSLD